jgi:VanZ family protein
VSLEASLILVRRLARWAFPFYAVLIFSLTHWPNLKIPVPGRPDLIVHMVVFGGWTVLVTACGFFGAWWSHRNIALSATLAAVYAAFDEATQGIPIIQRYPALDDWGANLLGVTTGALIMLMLAEILQRRMRAQ